MSIHLQDFIAPKEIETRSFEIIESELGERLPFSGDCRSVALRLIHTTADYSLIPDLCLSEAAVEAGIKALLSGATVFTDTEMARAGMPRYRLDALGVRVECFISLPGVAEAAEKSGRTRARTGIEFLGKRLENSIVAIGNAPTALLALLEYIDSGAPAPALIIGMPVGFVNASESKELLLQRQELCSLVVRGRRGGSPLAAATVNALANLALRRL